MAIAIVYGWAVGTKGSSEAARTDDILTIIQMQFDSMPPGPKAIAGDLNGSIEAFPTLAIMLEEQGWTDIGNDSSKCGGRPGQPTCQANDGVKESRIDYFIANDRLTPAVVSCKVDHGGDFKPTGPSSSRLQLESLRKLRKNSSDPIISPPSSMKKSKERSHQKKRK